MATLEQKRLLNVVSDSFSAMRSGKLMSEEKALLLSATNHMDRLRGLFGRIGTHYQKLAATA